VSGEPDPLRFLSTPERDCLRRYCALLREQLGDELLRVVLFGSAARGDMWGEGSPMRSDIDLLVVTRSELSSGQTERLVNETYPLYLECGRQIGPQFRSAAALEQVADDRAEAFARNLGRDGVDLEV
jgi:predicted nucleotidyltransferase